MKKYHKNPRVLTKAQYKLLERDLRELGDLSGIVHDINSDEIISGNQRITIFNTNENNIDIVETFDPPTKTGTIATGWTKYNGERYSYRRVKWTPEKCEKANIVANKAGGSWDWDILANEFDFDSLQDWGFSEDELAGLDFGDAGGGETEDDAVPEDVETFCKTGDLWQLGDHRLLCGDSTKKEDVERLMGGEKADMVFTDPPYGVDYDGGIQFTKDGVKTGQRKKLDGDSSTAIYSKVMPIINSHLDGACYIWFADTKALELYQSIKDNNFDIHALIIWVKNGGYGALNANSKQKHEPCLYIKPKGSTLGYCGSTTETTIWEIDKDGKNKLHPTQKPVGLAERAIKNHTAKTVLDPFLGSGSTIIACEKTNRKCYGIELDEHYCDVIIARWEEYTGKKAGKIDG